MKRAPAFRDFHLLRHQHAGLQDDPALLDVRADHGALPLALARVARDAAAHAGRVLLDPVQCTPYGSYMDPVCTPYQVCYVMHPAKTC